MASADDSLEAVIGFAMRGDAKALQVRVATVSNCLDLFDFEYTSDTRFGFCCLM